MATILSRKEELLARAAALKTRARGIEAELTSHATPDWEELATEREGDEVLEGMGQEAMAELRSIAAALGRIEAGDYGICQVCGAEIQEARLDILPQTPCPEVQPLASRVPKPTSTPPRATRPRFCVRWLCAP